MQQIERTAGKILFSIFGGLRNILSVKSAKAWVVTVVTGRA